MEPAQHPIDRNRRPPSANRTPPAREAAVRGPDRPCIRPILPSIRLGLVVGAALLLPAPAPAADNPNAGLWVGSVVVEKVNRAGKTGGSWDPDVLLPAANPFAFRLLVHVDTNGQARLLQRVLTVCNPNGEIVTNAVTGQSTTNGFYVLLADESQVQAYIESARQSKVYRVSSVNFPIMSPQPMAGAFGGTGFLACTVPLPYDDAVNPLVALIRRFRTSGPMLHGEEMAQESQRRISVPQSHQRRGGLPARRGLGRHLCRRLSLVYPLPFRLAIGTDHIYSLH